MSVALSSDALLSMTWRDVLFAHWPVDPEVVARRLPDGLSVDTHEGRAYLGVVPFVMEGIRPRGVPEGLGLSFPELNLRTYVDGPDGPGIYFFHLDADDPVGVPIARRVFRLPYYRAGMSTDRRGERVRFRSERVHRGQPPLRFDATYEATGPADPPERGSLAAFLTERYRFYTGDGALWTGTIDHEPWPLRPGRVEFRRDDSFTAERFDRPDGEPICHVCDRIDVTAGRLRRVQ